MCWSSKTTRHTGWHFLSVREHEAELAGVPVLCEGPVRQCAWCGRVSNERGAFELASGRKLRWASHGICPRCKEAERAEIELAS
jgi:hypothetical protein